MESEFFPTDRRTDTQAGMRKLIFAYRSFANVSKKYAAFMTVGKAPKYELVDARSITRRDFFPWYSANIHHVT
jgi:hypothetical protein